MLLNVFLMLLLLLFDAANASGNSSSFFVSILPATTEAFQNYPIDIYLSLLSLNTNETNHTVILDYGDSSPTETFVFEATSSTTTIGYYLSISFSLLNLSRYTWYSTVTADYLLANIEFSSFNYVSSIDCYAIVGGYIDLLVSY